METTPTRNFIPVLSIAGSDPSGGAGIQQDIKTCEAFGCYGMAAITALTAQSHKHVMAVKSTSDFLEDQLKALLDEVRPSAVKIGMLPDIKSVVTIADTIMEYALTNIVVDPIIFSTSGHLLSDGPARKVLKDILFPLATVITPNIPELTDIHHASIVFPEDARLAAKELAEECGCDAILIKGGHASWNDDILYMSDPDTYTYYRTKWIDTPNTHGTGCRLSTAIACNLAKGHDIPMAVRLSKDWLTENLKENSSMRFPDPTI